ncbi:MAG: hypothetical protein LRY55_05500 [Leadbetterella sp.]|nr:hypothetical protein [Leadbetterella sp.]
MFGRVVFILLLGISGLAAQESAPGPLVSCPGHPFAGSFGEDLPLRYLRISERPSARFTPRYFEVPDSVRTVVEAAFAVWDKILISRVPIHIDVHWEVLAPGTWPRPVLTVCIRTLRMPLCVMSGTLLRWPMRLWGRA